MSAPCPVPSRWVLDELARELAFESAEWELNAARALLDYFGVSEDEVYDRYIAALEARNALRDGRP